MKQFISRRSFLKAAGAATALTAVSLGAPAASAACTTPVPATQPKTRPRMIATTALSHVHQDPRMCPPYVARAAYLARSAGLDGGRRSAFRRIRFGRRLPGPIR